MMNAKYLVFKKMFISEIRGRKDENEVISLCYSIVPLRALIAKIEINVHIAQQVFKAPVISYNAHMLVKSS